MDSKRDSKANITATEKDTEHVAAQPTSDEKAKIPHSQRNGSSSLPHAEEDPPTEVDDLDGLVNNKLIKAEQERENTEHKKAEKKRIGDEYDEPIEIATSPAKESDKEDDGPVKNGRKLKVRFADAELGVKKKSKGKLSSKNEKAKKSRVKIKTELVDAEDEREHHDQHVDAQEGNDHHDQAVDTQEENGEPVAKRRGARTRKTPERYDPSRGIGSKGEGVPPPKASRNFCIQRAKGALLSSPLQLMPPQPILPNPSQPILPQPVPLDVVDVEAIVHKESAKKESKKKKASAKEINTEVMGVIEKDEKPLESDAGLVSEAGVMFTRTIIDLLHENRDEILNILKRSLSGGEDSTSKKIKKSRK